MLCCKRPTQSPQEERAVEIERQLQRVGCMLWLSCWVMSPGVLILQISTIFLSPPSELMRPIYPLPSKDQPCLTTNHVRTTIFVGCECFVLGGGVRIGYGVAWIQVLPVLRHPQCLDRRGHRCFTFFKPCFIFNSQTAHTAVSLSRDTANTELQGYKWQPVVLRWIYHRPPDPPPPPKDPPSIFLSSSCTVI